MPTGSPHSPALFDFLSNACSFVINFKSLFPVVSMFLLSLRCKLLEVRELLSPKQTLPASCTARPQPTSGFSTVVMDSSSAHWDSPVPSSPTKLLIPIASAWESRKAGRKPKVQWGKDSRRTWTVESLEFWTHTSGLPSSFFIHSFINGCAGSSLPCGGFLVAGSGSTV